MTRTIGHRIGAALLLLAILGFYLATRVSHHPLYHLLLLSAPALSLIGSVTLVTATIRSGTSFGDTGDYVLRSAHKGRFYVSVATLVLLLVAWVAAMIILTLLAWDPPAA